MGSYSARFECSICQGTLPDASFSALSCGHCYHTACVSKWLERSSTCPGCRAKASTRQIRALCGVDAVLQEGDEETPQQTSSDQQQLTAQLREAEAASEQQKALNQELSAVVQDLEDEQARTKAKLDKYRHRCQDLERQRLQDCESLTAVNTELTRLKDTYWSKCQAVERLQKDLQSERKKRADAEILHKRAESNLRHLQLQNPSLSLEAMQHLLDAQDQGGHALNADQLLATLARRNEQLKQAEDHMAQLRAQLQQQHQQAEAQLAAAHSRQQAVESRMAKQQDESMKQVIQLEYMKDKLEKDNTSLTQQVQELQGVLLALEGAAGQRQQSHSRPQQDTVQQRVSSFSGHLSMPQGGRAVSQDASRQDTSAGPSQQQCSSCFEQPGTTEPCSQGVKEPASWQADVEAAVGPGVLLHRPAHITRAPSFLRPGAQAAGCAGVEVQGNLVRQGPDGRGSTARHAGSFLGKRAPAHEPLKAANKKARPPGSTNILNFFGRAGS